VYNGAKDDAPAMRQTSGSVAESQRLSRRPSVPEDTTANDLPTKDCRKFGAEYPHTLESFDSRLAVTHQLSNIPKECYSR
jgi:hypothetical protein